MSTDTWPKLSDCGCAFIFGATPWPLSLTVCDPNEALLFTRSSPCCLPFAVGTNATSIVQEAPGCSSPVQLLEVTTNPLLNSGCDKLTGTAAAWLATVIFAGLPWWPTTSLGNEIDLGLASSLAKTGLAVAAGAGVTAGVDVMAAAGVPAAWPIGLAPEIAATSAAHRIRPCNDRSVTFPAACSRA